MQRPLTLLLIPLAVLVLGLAAGLWLAAASLALESNSRALLGDQMTVRFAWEGAPLSTRPLLVRCQADGILLEDSAGGPARFFAVDQLAWEAVVVKGLQDRVAGAAAQGTSRRRQWRALGKLLLRDPRLRDSLSLALWREERSGGPGRQRRAPLLLVQPEGVQSYTLTATLIDAATLWPVVAEPVLPGWRVEGLGRPTPGAPVPTGRDRP